MHWIDFKINPVVSTGNACSVSSAASGGQIAIVGMCRPIRGGDSKGLRCEQGPHATLLILFPSDMTRLMKAVAQHKLQMV